MGIDAQVQRAGRERPWSVRIAVVALTIVIIALIAQIASAALRGDDAGLAQAAGGCWWLSMLAPLLVVVLAATVRRGPGRWMWIGLWVGAALAMVGPLLMRGGDETASTYLPGRWGSGADISLAGFTWLSGVTAAALIFLALLSHRHQRRHARRAAAQPSLANDD